VSRDALVRRLWPSDTFVDYEQGLKKAVNRLREALHDSAEQPRFIETLARQGYRFIGNVELEPPDGSQTGKSAVLAPHLVTAERIPSRSRRHPLSRPIAFSALAVVICAAGIWFWRREVRPAALPEVKQRRLTTSLSDDPVRSGAISPDGRFLAYADLEGLHVRIIDTGETRDVPQPKELHIMTYRKEHPLLAARVQLRWRPNLNLR
jgi:hypothetical protein